jgi:hypothetical protein
VKPKTFVAFTAVTAVVTLAALAAVAGRYWAVPTHTELQPFPELLDRLGEVAEITVQSRDGMMTMKQVGDVWQMAEKHGYPIRGDRVRKLAIGLAEMRLEEPKTKKPERYARLGVEDLDAEDAESKLVTLKTADGTGLAQLVVGREKSRGGRRGVYVRLPGEEQAWLSPADLEMGTSVEGWLQERIIHVAPQRISRLTTIQPDSETLVLYKDSPDDEHFKFKDLPEDAVLKGESAADGTAAMLIAVGLADVAPESEFDFSAQGVTRAKIGTFDGLLISVDMVEKEGDTWARFAASQAPAAAAAAPGEGGLGDLESEIAEINARVGGWAYKMNEWNARSLKVKLAEFLEEEELPVME